MARGIRSAAFMPLQHERRRHGRTRDDVRTLKRRERRAPLGLRLLRRVLQPCKFFTCREDFSCHARPVVTPSLSHSPAPNSPAKLACAPRRRRRPPHKSGPKIPRPSPASRAATVDRSRSFGCDAAARSGSAPATTPEILSAPTPLLPLRPGRPRSACAAAPPPCVQRVSVVEQFGSTG